MLKYQLGSGSLAGRELIILHWQGKHLDLLTVLQNSLVRDTVSLAQNELPTSLMDMMQRWSYWQDKLPQVVAALFSQQGKGDLPGLLDGAAIRWLPPLMYPRKLICLGANYSEHNAEMGNMTTRPKYPYTFLEPATTALVGSGHIVQIPEMASMIDWEVELAVVIGQKVRNVQGANAMASIAGYSVLNDITARDWVSRETRSHMGLDWVMIKGFDGFAPMGPYITPAEFVPDPQNLTLTLSVNGQEKQRSTTAMMIFQVREIIEHLSRIMTLEPGDVIATGTPSGVGFGRNPREFLQSGDIMIAEIEGLGRLENQVK